VGASEQIAALLYRYAALLDSGDLDGVAELFEHASWRSTLGTEVLQGAAAVRRVYDDVILYDGVPLTRHVISNVDIVCDDAPVASSRCYFTVLQATPAIPLQPILAGRYDDEFERVDGVWRFTDRLIHPDLLGDLSGHMRSTRRGS
jgi:3-phenylpropionate/cinnamic acid dioxygenase small subunit